MFSKIADAVTGFWNGLTGPSRSGVSRQLRADSTQHKAGEATNLIASLSTFATNGLHALTVRTRRVRTKLRDAVLAAADTLTKALLALERFRTDPAVVANASAAKTAREYDASGKSRFLDVRVWRVLVLIVAAIVAIADFGFMFAVYRDLFVLSLESFQLAQLGEWAVAITLPLLFPAVVIALAEFGGKSVGRGRARRMHPERAEQIFGDRLSAYEKSWGPRWTALIHAGAALLIGGFFFIMAIHRFGTAASDAGLDFPAWALAVGYGILPIVALLVDIASRDVVLEHDRTTLKLFARNERIRAKLEGSVLEARTGLATAWLALKWRIARILQDANQSIVMFEQLVTDGYAHSGAIGDLAPLAHVRPASAAATDATATATDDAYAIPSLVQRRSITTPIVQWLTTELEADLDLLRAHRPDGDAGERAVARVLGEVDAEGAAAADAEESGAADAEDPGHAEREPQDGATHVDGVDLPEPSLETDADAEADAEAEADADDTIDDQRHEVIEFPDRHTESEAAS